MHQKYSCVIDYQTTLLIRVPYGKMSPLPFCINPFPQTSSLLFPGARTASMNIGLPM